jgi:hypothetical protein
VSNAVVVNSTAQSFASGAGLAQSTAVAQGAGGLTQATSTSTGGVATRIVTAASAQAGGTSNVGTITSFGSTGLILPDLSGANTGLHAFSYADGAPDPSLVASELASHRKINHALVASGLQTLALGSMGAQIAMDASAVNTYSASAEYSFTLAHASGVLLGLLDFSGHDSGNSVSITFSVSNFGSSLLNLTFSSLSDADTYFSDHALSLGTMSGNVDLLLNYTLVGQTDQAADFSYLLATGPLTNSGTSISPVPEVDPRALLLLGLGVLAAFQRLMRARRC